MTSCSVRNLRKLLDHGGWRYNVGSDEEVLVSGRDFLEVRCRPKPHHFGFLCVELKVVHKRHTSFKPSSDVTDVGRLTLLDALHVVSKQMMADTMLLKNVGDILGVCNKRPRSRADPCSAQTRSSLTNDDSVPTTAT